jgi:hypothetical protein
MGVVEVAIYLFLRSIVRDLNGPIVSAGSTIWVELLGEARRPRQSCRGAGFVALFMLGIVSTIIILAKLK